MAPNVEVSGDVIRHLVSAGSFMRMYMGDNLQNIRSTSIVRYRNHNFVQRELNVYVALQRLCFLMSSKFCVNGGTETSVCDKKCSLLCMWIISWVAGNPMRTRGIPAPPRTFTDEAGFHSSLENKMTFA